MLHVLALHLSQEIIRLQPALPSGLSLPRGTEKVYNKGQICRNQPVEYMGAILHVISLRLEQELCPVSVLHSGKPVFHFIIPNEVWVYSCLSNPLWRRYSSLIEHLLWRKKVPVESLVLGFKERDLWARRGRGFLHSDPACSLPVDIWLSTVRTRCWSMWAVSLMEQDFLHSSYDKVPSLPVAWAFNDYCCSFDVYIYCVHYCGWLWAAVVFTRCLINCLTIRRWGVDILHK